MKRSELKQLIRETIEELTGDTYRRAGDAASSGGKPFNDPKAAKFYKAAAKKDDTEVSSVFGQDRMLQIKPHSVTNSIRKFKIIGFGKHEGRPAIRILSDKDEVIMVTDDRNGHEVVLINYYGKTVPAKFDLDSKKKLIKGFEHMGQKIDPNRIQLIDKDKNS